MQCYIHKEVDAITICKVCGKEFCETCVSISENNDLCPYCAIDKENQKIKKYNRLLSDSRILIILLIILPVSLAYIDFSVTKYIILLCFFGIVYLGVHSLTNNRWIEFFLVFFLIYFGSDYIKEDLPIIENNLLYLYILIIPALLTPLAIYFYKKKQQYNYTKEFMEMKTPVIETKENEIHYESEYEQL